MERPSMRVLDITPPGRAAKKKLPGFPANEQTD